MKYIMKNTMRRLSWVVGAALIGVFGLLIVIMASYAIYSKLASPDSTLIADARCWLDIPAQNDGQCLKERLALMQRKHEDMTRKRRLEHEKIIAEKRRIEQRMKKVIVETSATRDKLEKRFKELQGLENKFDTINLFATKTFKGETVTTGVQYKKLSTGQKWTRAWCYLQPTNKQGSTLHFTIGIAHPKGAIKWETHGTKSIHDAKLSKSYIKAARKFCVWPKGVS